MYERAVQWLAAPVTGAIVLGAETVFHSAVSHNAAENVAVVVVTGAVATVTHAKWFTNLAKWWSKEEQSISTSTAHLGAGGYSFSPEDSPNTAVGYIPDPAPSAAVTTGTGNATGGESA